MASRSTVPEQAVYQAKDSPSVAAPLVPFHFAFDRCFRVNLFIGKAADMG
jgi:hypothetical protein